MSEPSLVVRRNERDAQGNLLSYHLTEVRRILRARGFVMLPSDTAYSVATWMRVSQTRRQINELLDREKNEPISLAFPSAEVVRRWTTKNAAADHLLECFTPGPITVVRTASRLVPVAFTQELMGGLNHTMGVRIPNSAEERQVAGLGANVVTTVPVRNLKVDRRPPVTSFDEAVASIKDRVEAFDGAPWCAIEGELLYPVTSSVVEVLGKGGNYTILRQGAIPKAEIQACIEGRQS
jgi:tRNA A37 threonylcarbamoyladenosine synthetase subunit TsaC/SUA5/YrdC